MASFDTNVLVYATASISEVKVMRARDLIARAMRAASSVKPQVLCSSMRTAAPVRVCG
jgi:hypothetical protein